MYEIKLSVSIKQRFAFPSYLALHSNTKTNKLRFHLVLVLAPNKQVYSSVFEFFHFHSQQFFCEKLCRIVI